MNEIQTYAPVAIYVITTLIGFKIFARRDELIELETKMITYINEHFTRIENHNDLKDQIVELRKDVSDIKKLLIDYISKGRK